METCSSKFVTGECHGQHLGKFSSCHDEALYHVALESGDGCGDGDWHGYVVPVTVEGPHEDLTVDGNAADLLVVEVPAGFYFVFTSPTGAVTVTRADDKAEWERFYADWESAYHEWRGDN